MKHTIYSQKSSKKIKSYKKLLFLLTVLLIIAVGGFFAYKHFYQNKNNTVYSPPTEVEKKSGDYIKPEVVKRQEQEDAQKKDNSEQTQNNQQPPSSSNATVVITDAGQYDNIIEVRAFVSNRYQDGTCKVTLTKNGLTVSKTTEAYKDATTTICTNPLFNRSEFSQAGDWQVIVEYNSLNYSGKSNPQTVQIK